MCSPEALQLQALLKDDIQNNGPMRLDRFMGLVLGHPQWGYYMRQDPLGTQGDFTTAPEISQLFGEMIGLWLVDMWMQMGKPSPFLLVEAGPGRGTLMADILRVSKEFRHAAEIHLLEMSPVLKDKQKQSLAQYNVTWHSGLESVPNHAPLLFVANEFFDALPIRQFVHKGADGWFEREVQVNPHHNDEFILSDTPSGSFDPIYDIDIPPAKNDGIIEVSADRADFMKALSRRIKEQSGAGLIVDYGHLKSGYGDTFQALYKHKMVDALSYIGDADLTSHVDFDVLMRVALGQGVHIAGAAEQGKFLKTLGIETRAQILAKHASEQQRQDLQKALHRLTYSGEMGTLFKVTGIYYHAFQLRPAGFNSN